MKKWFVFLCFLSVDRSYAQNIVFAHKMVDILTSSFFWGRGYTKDGMIKAAAFIANQFKTYGVVPLNDTSYFQPFSYPVNTFPDKMEVIINQKKLIPGKDFIVSPDSRGVKAIVNLQQKDSTHFVNLTKHIIVSLEDKLTWSVAATAADYTIIQVDKKALKTVPATIKAAINNKEITSFKTANVCGWVKGTRNSDSIIVISAHYDHLGGMGATTFFPGANDNASGTSLLLGLAKYYAAYPAPYTIALVAFAGEEAGLLGSKYFTENPLFPLKNIHFLINLDLEGTGDEGITVVNATTFPNQFAKLQAVNDSGKFLVKINARGKAANSDHYWFTEKGVPSFFMYTLGGIKAYHDVYDQAATLPLNKYENLFKLITSFNAELMK